MTMTINDRKHKKALVNELKLQINNRKKQSHIFLLWGIALMEGKHLESTFISDSLELYMIVVFQNFQKMTAEYFRSHAPCCVSKFMSNR